MFLSVISFTLTLNRVLVYLEIDFVPFIFELLSSVTMLLKHIEKYLIVKPH